ncbi:alpha-2-HS-glycoprotein 1 isoform X2 [Lates calcarifer]|uniref:Alpha-2-HS-glycoprotein 1 isoform X2 n=1 Tax=Lates calcarifer TaxID=8187 RepID=A0AAJ8BHR3_LATCA|nr:alpha-2-HS-glycoprotein 1 isoform X2 [Lates calcarifer]
MKRVLVLVLLSSAVLLCSCFPGFESVTCSEDSGNATAHLAMHHINEHHDHGYKFRLNEIQGNKVEKVGEGCDVTLQLDLLETVCHTVNPKNFEDCEIREEINQQVMANCTVMVTVGTGDAKITKYECDTQQVKSNVEMIRICPDCPILIPLNSPEGLKSVNEAVKEFNKNNSNQHYYTLQEVGRIRSGYMMMAGMSYYAEFALVETNCPMGSRIIPEACKPLCPDRARHAFCRSSYSSGNGLHSVECEFYPPLNTTALGPGEQEPICRHSPIPYGRPPYASGEGHPPHAGDGGHPPHAGDGGHPPHARSGGPPPHAGSGGPPPHAGRERVHPLQPFHPCHGFLTNSNPALHPICPWPHPGPRPNPKPSQS